MFPCFVFDLPIVKAHSHPPAFVREGWGEILNAVVDFLPFAGVVDEHPAYITPFIKKYFLKITNHKYSSNIILNMLYYVKPL